MKKGQVTAMTRKRYIKLLMSVGLQRNEANEMAAVQRRRGSPYNDFRGPWEKLNVGCLRFLLGVYKIMDRCVREA